MLFRSLGKGYTAGVGMTIGTAFGRIAGTRAAAAALGHNGANTLNIIEERDRAAA